MSSEAEEIIPVTSVFGHTLSGRLRTILVLQWILGEDDVLRYA